MFRAVGWIPPSVGMFRDTYDSEICIHGLASMRVVCIPSFFALNKLGQLKWGALTSKDQRMPEIHILLLAGDVIASIRRSYKFLLLLVGNLSSKSKVLYCIVQYSYLPLVSSYSDVRL
jgi:hypothetical protein